jgi:hypothetical protein
MNVNFRCQLERFVEYGCYVMEYYVQIISSSFCRVFKQNSQPASACWRIEYELFTQ